MVLRDLQLASGYGHGEYHTKYMRGWLPCPWGTALFSYSRVTVPFSILIV